MAKLNDYERRVPWHFVGFVFGLVLAILGGMIGCLLAIEGREKGLYDEARRTHLQDTCVAGNENACRIYEVDYGRR